MFKIAIRNLTNRKVRSWLTLIGIFAGIAAIVALVSLGQGLQGAVTSQFDSLGVDTLTIEGAGTNMGPPGTNAVGKLSDHDIYLIERLNGVSTVFGRYFKPNVVYFHGESEVVFLASAPFGKDSSVVQDVLDLNIADGYFISGEDTAKLTIGSKLKIGDETPTLGSKIIINDVQFRVAGILEKKGNPMFDKAILISEKSMEDVLGEDGNYSMIIVAAEPGADILQLRSSIERTLRKDRDQDVGAEDFVISSPQEMLDAFNEILTIVQILLVGVAAISLLVGSIGILNTMYTAVLERRKEIGIMKSIGATNEQVLGIFLIESGFLGLLGGVIGLILGILISKGVEWGVTVIYDINLLKAALPWWLLLGSLLFAFIIGSLAGTLPARQASLMDPVESLRK